MEHGVSLGKQLVKLEAAGKTDPGRVREMNEDNILLSSELNLFLVCDGMGGHATGNIASKLAIKSIHNFFEATSHAPFEEPPHKDDGDAPPEARRLASAIRKANRDVHEISTSHERHKGMGSTVVAIHVHGDQLITAHTGDSRCYRFRDGELTQLTRDHSLHNEALALKPNLSAEKLAKLPKNVVTRALGMKDYVQVELGRHTIQAGDILLLCSDGLYNMVKEDDIVGVLELQEELKESCELLVAMANDAGGTDNISVLLVRIDEILEPPPVLAPAPAPKAPVPFVSAYDQPPSEPPPPPTSDPLEPTRVVTLKDETNEELAEMELALAAFEQAKQELLVNAPQGMGECARCTFPRLSWNDYCTECGQLFPP